MILNQDAKSHSKLCKKNGSRRANYAAAAYDYRTAVVADRLGMDILCVSDTGGMILLDIKARRVSVLMKL